VLIGLLAAANLARLSDLNQLAGSARPSHSAPFTIKPRLLKSSHPPPKRQVQYQPKHAHHSTISLYPQTTFMTSSPIIHDQFRKFICQHG
jgi:hypothetical protein